MNFQTWFPNYLNAQSHSLGGASLERYRQLGRHAIDFLGETDLRDITPVIAAEMYSKLKTKGLSATTVAQVHTVLRQSLDLAVVEGVVSANRIKKMKVRGGGRKSHIKYSQVLIDSVSTAFRYARGRKPHALHAFVEFQIHTGARRNETLALTWSDIDFAKQRVRISRSLIDVGGKASFKEPKTESGNRTIEISGSLVRTLDAHWRSLGRSYPETGLVFPRDRNLPDIPLRGVSVTKAFQSRLRRTGLKGLRLHDLRHAHASILLNQGVPVKAVSRRLGHATVAVTLEIYGHLMDEAHEQMRSVLENL